MFSKVLIGKVNRTKWNYLVKGHNNMSLYILKVLNHLPHNPILAFIFQLREYPCNITHDILFLTYNGYF